MQQSRRILHVEGRIIVAKVSVVMESDEPKDFNQTLAELQDRAENLSRGTEPGLINEDTGASISVREDGGINISAGYFSQQKLSDNGRNIDISLESSTITNRKTYMLDDMVINNHKLNPSLWEFTDFKTAVLQTNSEAVVGNFCLLGSVLVKAWEPNLKRYMLIRRPCRMPMFGNTINVQEIHPALKVTDPLQFNDNIIAKSDFGYQVNGLIKDDKSLIGKEGQDRAGIVRSAGDYISQGYDTSGKAGTAQGYHGFASNGTGMDVLAPHPNPPGEGVERWAPYVADALKANGIEPTDEMVSKVLRQIDTESDGDPSVIQSDEVKDVNYPHNKARGLMQVIPPTFDSYSMNGHTDPFNGYDSLLAGINYAKERYGDKLNGLGEGHGY